MSSSKSHSRESSDVIVTLTVNAENPATELFIVDSSFALSDRGVHRLEAKLQPGIYKVKARLGLREWEQPISVDKDMTVEVPPIEFASAAPLTETACATDAQMDFAVQASRDADSRTGSGSRIFVMSRVWTGDASAAKSHSQVPLPFRQVKIRRWRGDVIADLGEDGNVLSGDDLAVAFCIEVNEGNYLVEFETQNGVNLLPICAREGWQTQIFILHGTAFSVSDVYNDVSILMTRGNFEPSDSIARATDAARLALAQDRVVASDHLMDYAQGKVENPILGLVSAHMLLLAQKKQQEKQDRARKHKTEQIGPELEINFDQGRYHDIVSKISELLGADQPDVAALSLRCAVCKPVSQIRVPPMFWRSWKMLIEASNDNTDLIPESLWRRVDSVSNLRPFFSWIETDKSQAKSLGAVLGTVDGPFAGAVATARELQARVLHAQLESVSNDPLQKPSPDQLKNWAIGVPGSSLPATTQALAVEVEDSDQLKRKMTAQLAIPRGMLDRALKS